MKHLIWTVILLPHPQFQLTVKRLTPLVDVGGYKLHFTLIKGKGTPILFEAGGGNDGTVWNGIVKSIADVTNAPIIMYDRRGLGKSSKDSINIGIENEIKGLRNGLKKLGFHKNIMFVSHSLGGFYNMVLCDTTSDRSTGGCFIDVNLPCFLLKNICQMGASENFSKYGRYGSEKPFTRIYPGDWYSIWKNIVWRHPRCRPLEKLPQWFCVRFTKT